MAPPSSCYRGRLFQIYCARLLPHPGSRGPHVGTRVDKESTRYRKAPPAPRIIHYAVRQLPSTTGRFRGRPDYRRSHETCRAHNARDTTRNTSGGVFHLDEIYSEQVCVCCRGWGYFLLVCVRAEKGLPSGNGTQSTGSSKIPSHSSVFWAKLPMTWYVHMVLT